MTPTPAILAEIDSHAIAAWPREACGLLLREAEGEPFYRPCDNVAGDDPVVDAGGRPRGPRRAYQLDPHEVLRAARERLEMLAIVHSHPGGDARFSALDRNVATTMGRDGIPVPTWPGVLHCVVGADKNHVTERRWFAWDDAVQGWVEVPGR